jgi:hypothetical protein
MIILTGVLYKCKKNDPRVALMEQSTVGARFLVALVELSVKYCVEEVGNSRLLYATGARYR